MIFGTSSCAEPDRRVLQHEAFVRLRLEKAPSKQGLRNGLDMIWVVFTDHGDWR